MTKIDVSKLVGEVVMGPESKWKRARYKCDVAITRDGSDETIEFVSASNGDVF